MTEPLDKAKFLQWAEVLCDRIDKGHADSKALGEMILGMLASIEALQLQVATLTAVCERAGLTTFEEVKEHSTRVLAEADQRRAADRDAGGGNDG